MSIEVRQKAELANRIEEIKETAKTVLSNTHSQNTKQSYKSDVKHLEKFCNEFGLDISNLNEESYLIFLSSQIDKGFKVSSIKRQIVAINKYLTSKHGYNFKKSETAKDLLKGALRTKREKFLDDYRTNKEASKAITLDDLKKAIWKISESEKINDTLKLRNKTLLLAGFVGGFRVSELLNIRKSDLVFSQKGGEVILHKTKTNQDLTKKEIKTIPFAKDANFCPVVALQDLTKDLKDNDFVFQSIQKGGISTGKKLSRQSFNNLIKKYVGSEYTTHSLRAGMVTTAYENGSNIKDIMTRTGHRDLNTAMSYVRTLDTWNAKVDLGF